VDDLNAEPGEALEARIDYIFLAPGEGAGFSLVSAQRALDEPVRTEHGWQWASDHVGLLIVLAPEG
jgi:hypothetical protein